LSRTERGFIPPLRGGEKRSYSGTAWEKIGGELLQSVKRGKGVLGERKFGHDSEKNRLPERTGEGLLEGKDVSGWEKKPVLAAKE